MTQAAMEQIVCAGCGKSYRWKPELAGKKGKCKCGQLLQFPMDDPGAQAAAAMPKEEEAGEYELNEPVAAPKPVAPKAAVGIKACKGCSGMLAPGAVLCTRCGLNQTTGKKMATSVKGPGVEGGDVAKAAGKVVLSMVLGGVTAVICAVLWIVVEVMTGFRFGLAAVGIGLATGGVMRLVNPNGGKITGYGAVGFALFALALVKGVEMLGAVGMGLGVGGAFTPFDILWTFLAVSSAWRMGSRTS